MIVRGKLSTVRKLCATALCFVLLVARVDALTLEDLLLEQKATPKRFAAHFETFEYEFHREVQTPDSFLSSRRGDCDDYAVLADFVLKRVPYETRIIRVSLVGRIAHDVCYVTQVKGYLDFNNRKYALNVERSGRTLREIATEVAHGFQANWTSVSEYTYDYKEAKKHFQRTVVKTDPPAQDPDVGPPAKPASR